MHRNNAKKIKLKEQEDTVPPMTDFDFDEIVSILLGVKPKEWQKTEAKSTSETKPDSN